MTMFTLLMYSFASNLWKTEGRRKEDVLRTCLLLYLYIFLQKKACGLTPPIHTAAHSHNHYPGNALNTITKHWSNRSVYAKRDFMSSTVSIFKLPASLPTVPSNTRRFFSWSCRIRSSSVFYAMNRTARIGRYCPSLWVRSIACLWFDVWEISV